MTSNIGMPDIIYYYSNVIRMLLYVRILFDEHPLLDRLYYKF